jgi:hypothetical protein
MEMGACETSYVSRVSRDQPLYEVSLSRIDLEFNLNYLPISADTIK